MQVTPGVIIFMNKKRNVTKRASPIRDTLISDVLGDGRN
jgi:hypothetical protein